MAVVTPVKGIQSLEIIVGIRTEEYDFYNRKYLEDREITFMSIEGSFSVMSMSITSHGPDSTSASFQLRRKHK